MSEPVAISDKALCELALKIEAELPEEISRFVTLKQDTEGKSLVVDWSVQLAPEDLKLLTDVVAGYGGSFVNLKDSSGKDRRCFSVPRNQPPPSVSSCAQPKQPENQASQESPMKQQSPLTLFQGNYCGSCTDQATCTPRTGAGRQRLAICFKVMELQYFDFISEHLHKLCQIQEETGRSLLRVQPSKPSPQGGDLKPVSEAKLPVSPPQPTVPPVQRSTRPEQGHIDQGIIWTNELGSRGQYEKATEKDNMDRDAYFKLADWVAEHEDKPFKDGYFYWLFDQGAPAIGRKKTQPRRGSR